MCYFVAIDWIQARVITDREPYGSYLRFSLDLIAAALAYIALRLAVMGNPSASSYVGLMFLTGALWAVACIADNPESALRRRFQGILVSHIFGSVALWLFWSWNASNGTVSWPDVLVFFGFLATAFLVDEILLISFTEEQFWLGPNGVLIGRKKLKHWRHVVREVFRR